MANESTSIFCDLRDRSLFITEGGWGGGGADNFRGNQLIFGRTKGGISCNWEAKRGNHWKFKKDSEGGPLKFVWKMKTWRRRGSRKTSKVIRGAGSLQ